LLSKINGISVISLLLAHLSGCAFFALDRGKSAKIGFNWPRLGRGSDCKSDGNCLPIGKTIRLIVLNRGGSLKLVDFYRLAVMERHIAYSLPFVECPIFCAVG